ncbi:MAG TPA: serine/threonine-protein kinase [Candidatus Acidoferrales bacterium]|nr:serine/threonine-protein kinase [Candidatus Acidoferrales bacterium]
MVRCPSCARECADNNRFCAFCATALDATSAETVLDAVSQPRLTSQSSVDEGRFLPGTVVAGRYRVAGLLGRGGMGEVYRATDLTLGQAVALKFLPETLSRDERALARFYNEVRIARQISHPNVCRVYDIGETQGLHYISMEFVDGEDLGSLLRRIGRLPVDKAVETARKLCAGLAAAHEKGVLHRDLKPANVMIDGRGQVVIMDFGLAGLAGQLQGDIRSGTPAYMSPEQLAGTEVTVKSDIYALGLLLYELFTGKRAFEAASLMELMQMQERAAPASITTVAKDLDPAVERVIMRCLHPDPRRRPSSVLAVAAGLPGGDPLAAALAAGETPSPDQVVAAGETEGLAPKVAIAWLAAVLAGLAIVEALAPSQTLTAKLPIENSPEALSRDAQKVVQSLGYTARPADRAWGLHYNDNYVDYLNRHPAEAKSRWQNPAAGHPPLIHFWYRQSPAPIAAVRGFNVAVSFSDPPMETSGMVRLRTDLDGKLLQFETLTPQVEAPAAQPAAPFEWSRLFQAAGLDMSKFQPTDPQWSPLTNADARAAWTGVVEPAATKLRVEAAAWRGRPVFFRISGPWSVPEQRPVPAGTTNQIPSLIVVYLALFSACVIAWRHARSGKSDQRGALKMGGLYFVWMAGSRMLFAHHTGTLSELNGFWSTVSTALINGGAVWVFYIALEPWVRRSWPHTIIGWNRFRAKGLRDPLVGRDLLYGLGFGTLLAILQLAGTAFQGNGGQPYMPALEALTGVRYELASLLNGLNNGIFGGLLDLFILFLLRVVLRKQWIASLVFVAITALTAAFGSSTPWVDYPVAAISGAVGAFILLRFGLLAAIAAHAGLQILESCPPTLDFSSWYIGLALIPPVVVALIALYGFRTALAGRPLMPET